MRTNNTTKIKLLFCTFGSLSVSGSGFRASLSVHYRFRSKVKKEVSVDHYRFDLPTMGKVGPEGDDATG